MTTVILILMMLMFMTSVRADAIRTAGDYLQIAIPAWALGRAAGAQDVQGLRQMSPGLALNLAATQGIKLATDQTRPDGGNLSFPSGHTSAAFQGAAFVHRRYGWEEAWPLYAGAAFVGYSRVHARRHYWRDVIAGAALGITVSWVTATPRQSDGLSFWVAPDSAMVSYTTTWR